MHWEMRLTQAVWRGRWWLAGAGLVLVLVWLLAPPWSVLGKCDLIGYGICHQFSGHSLHMAGVQLPLCARCTGTYLGAMLVIGWGGVVRRKRVGAFPSPGILIVLVGFVAWMAVDGLNSYLGFFPRMPQLYTPSNDLRLLTGLLNGVALASVVLPLANFSLWRDVQEGEAVLRGWRDLLVLVLVVLVIWEVVRGEPGWLLYPVAVVSILGVLVMLTLVNMTLVLNALGRERVAGRWWEALPWLLIGLGLGMGELLLLGTLRHTLGVGLLPV